MKRIVTVLLAVVFCAALMTVAACGGSGSGIKGTYYFYEDGASTSDWLELSGSTWETNDGLSGTYEVSGDEIVFYADDLLLFEGTIKDGVITVRMDGEVAYFCKSGYTPSGGSSSSSGSSDSGSQGGSSSGSQGGGSGSSGSGDDSGSQGGQVEEKVMRTVRFDYAGGNAGVASMEFEVGKSMAALPTPTKKNYKFICWTDAKGKEYTASSVMPSSDLYLTAEWEKLLSTYSDDFVSLKPATEGVKSARVQAEAESAMLDVDKYIYVEITSDNLTGEVGTENNFALRNLEGMEYSVASGYTWLWYQGDFNTPNGAQRFRLSYGSNIQLITVSDGSGIVQRRYLLDIYVLHDYYISLYKTIFDEQPYTKVRVIENEYFPATTATAPLGSFVFDKRVYYNEERGEYATFSYSTAIRKDWSLYQTYQAKAFTAELDGGALEGEISVKPYTQYFTLPVPTKEGYDFLGWQLKGKFITNANGYSGVNYLSAANDEETITAVWAAKRYYYEPDGDVLTTKATTPIVTYADAAMTELLAVAYTPVGADVTLPTVVPSVQSAIFTGWQYYYYSEANGYSTHLSDYTFEGKQTGTLCLAPEMRYFSSENGYGGYTAVPLNKESTYSQSTTYAMYFPADKPYTLRITTEGSVGLKINPFGYQNTTERTYTVTADSPLTVDLQVYTSNLGEAVPFHGMVTFTVTSRSGDFTVLYAGDSANHEGEPLAVTEENVAAVGAEISVLPEKVGYALLGWKEGEERAFTGLPVTILDREQSLTAEWQEVAIQNDAEAGSFTISKGEVINGTYALGDEVTLTAETNTGYTWVGWFDGDAKVSEDAELTYTFTITEGKTYAAKWAAYTLTTRGMLNDEEIDLGATLSLSFDLNGGTSGKPENQIITASNGMTYPTTLPTRSGYVFAGWYTSPACTTIFDFTQNITADTTVYAKWLAYDGAGVLPLNGTLSNLTVPLISSSSRQYYAFVPLVSGSITLYSSGSGDSYGALYNSNKSSQLAYNNDGGANQNFSITYSVTAGALYYVLPCGLDTITLSLSMSGAKFPAAGGKGSATICGSGTVKSDEKVTVGESVTLTASINAGYTWVGWYDGDAQVCADLEYSFTMPAENKTYTAKWIKVTLNRNVISGGTVSSLTGKYVVGDEVTVTASTNAGYTWIGWFDGETKVSEGTTLTYIFAMPAESKTYTAKWSSCPVALEKNIAEAGTVSGVSGATAVGAETTITATTNAGYTWLGWYDGDAKVSEGTSLTYTFTMTAESKTYTAKWTYYTVTTGTNLDGAGNYTVKSEEKVTAGESVTLTASTNTGYTWLGWYDGDEQVCAGLEYTLAMPSESKTYTAKWCRVTLAKNNDDAGAVTELTETYAVGDEVTVTASTNAGYTWLGWYDGDAKVSEGTSLTYTFTMPAESKTYTAKWSKVTLERSDASAGKVSSLMGKYVVGEEVTVTASTNPGYTWVGWFDGETKVSEGTSLTYTFTMPAESKTYTAKWAYYTLTTRGWLNDEEIDLGATLSTLSFDLNGGTSGKPADQYITPEIGMTYPMTLPTRSGYIFAGWYTSPACTTVFDFTQNITADTTVYAKWLAYDGAGVLPLNGTLSNISVPSKSSSSRPYYAFVPLVSGSITLYSSGGRDSYGYLYNSSKSQLAYNDDGGADKNFSITYSVTAGTLYYVMPCGYNGTITLSLSMSGATYPAAGEKAPAAICGFGTVKSDEKVTAGESVTLTASTNAGYTWLGWYDGDEQVCADLEYAFTMPAESKTYTAKWAAYTVTTQTNLSGAGSYTVKSEEKVTAGEIVTLTASTNTGYTWLGWYDGDAKVSEGTSLTYTFTMPAESKTYTAKWAAYTVTTQTNLSGAGSYTTKTNQKTTAGQSVTLTASTNAGYTWLGWYDGDERVCAGFEYTFAMPAESKTYTAKWIPCPVTLEKNIEDAGTVTELTETYAVGDEVTVTARTNAGYTWVGWFDGETKASEGTSLTYTFAMSAESKTYTAKWSKVTLERSDSSAGSISSLTGRYVVGDEVTITATTNAGYTWLGWYDGDAKVSEGTTLTYTFVMPAESKTYTAKWMACPVTLTKNIEDAGTVSGVERTILGAETTITALSNEGYTWLGWYDGDEKVSEGTNMTYTFMMSAEIKTFTATWAVCPVSIVKNIEEAGSITGLTDTQYEGDEVTISASSNIGYTWLGWYDGDELLAERSLTYTFTMPAESKTYTAKWSKVTIEKSIEAAGTATELTETYVFGDEIVLTATTNLGYTWLGWYDGETKVSEGTNSTYIFTMSAENRTYTATWACKQEMRGFLFTSDESNCTITGVKDTGVSEIIVPNYVTIIDEGAFSGCSSLEEMTIPFVGATKDGTSNTHFGYIFGAGSYDSNSSCVPSSLKTVVITGGTSIRESAFLNCNTLTSITIPNSVTSIGEGAFSGCSALENITIPFVGAEAGKLASDTWQYPFGFIFGETRYTGCSSFEQFYHGSFTSSYTSSTYCIPSTLRRVTVLGGNILPGAFYNCWMLTSVTIPASVTSIGAVAFYKCRGLTSITIPSSVTSIGAEAFSSCPASIVWGDNPLITAIGSYAFCRYGGTSITIPASVTSIGEGIFSDSALTSITVELSNQTYYSEGNCIIEKESKQLVAGCNASIIPSSATSIGSYAFYKCRGLTSITIPNRVTSIGSYAFSDCSGLTSITFAEVSQLTSIGDVAFSGCSGLTSITIPNGVTSIGKTAFSDCSGLTSITFAEVSQLTSIGNYVFYKCSGLTSITIPNSVTRIGDSAFYQCTGLKSITFSNGSQLTSIGEHAFYGCSGLTSITIPASVKEINKYAFENCTSLTSATFENPSKWCYVYDNNSAEGLLLDHSTESNAYMLRVYSDYRWKRS